MNELSGPVHSYLLALSAAARAVLGDDLSGFYVAGSLALGEFDPHRSDIDVAVVVTAELAASTKTDLARQLSNSMIRCPARGLELVVYTAAAASSGTPEPAFEMELNDGPSMDYRFTADPAARPREDGAFWYAIDRDILHQAGRPLIGPPAPSVFASTEPSELPHLLLEAMDWQQTRSVSPGAEAVLGACRSRIRVRTGRWYGKREAARRTAQDVPEWAAVVRAAIDIREGGTGDLDDAADFLLMVRGQILEP